MELTDNLFKKKKEELQSRLNESKATGAMVRAAREDDLEERDEAKEEEYDYFLDTLKDENAQES